MIVMVCSIYHCAGNCAVEFTSEPQDVTAFVGDSVQFPCMYSGTFDVPFWYIGGTGYSINRLPPRHSYRNRILTVAEVRLGDTQKTYQCSVAGLQSRIARLTVMRGEAIVLHFATSKKSRASRIFFQWLRW